jgi:lipopolysaccharide export system permease protein
MKKTITRYLIVEQLIPVSVSLLALILILVTGRLLQLTRYLFTSPITLLDLAQIIIFIMPKLLLFALPMATLVGVLLAFVRLSSDNELVALRASGVGTAQTLPAVLAVLLLTTSLSYVNAINIIPYSTQAFEYELKSLGRVSLPTFLKDRTFIDIVPNLVFYFREVNPSDLRIQGVFVQDQRQQDVRMVIVAERAQILTPRNINQIVFKISNGIITRVPDNLKDAQAVSFKTYDLTLDLDELFSTLPKIGGKGKRIMTMQELFEAMSDPSQKAATGYALEFHQRLALPLSCLCLGLIGPPLGSLFRPRSRMTGITLGMGVFLAYYVMLSAGKGLGENNIIPAGLAMWTPNILTTGLALYLWRLVHAEAPSRTLALLGRMTSSTRNHLRRTTHSDLRKI